MAFAPELLYPAAVVALGYFVLGVTGFGSSLMVVPLLSWKWPLQEVVPLALLLDVPAAVLQGLLNRRQVELTEVGRFVPPMILGSLAGMWLAGALEPQWPLLGLGLFVAAAGLGALRMAKQGAPQAHPKWRAVVGFSTGLVEVMFGTAGPLVLAWLQRRLTSVYAVRATTPVTIVLAALIALTVMAFNRTLSDSHMWGRWMLFLPLAGLAVLAGNRVARHLPAGLLRQLICALLVLSGVALAWQALH